MGIPTCRFVDQTKIKELICTICEDVAVNPVVIGECEHIFCQSCIKVCDNPINCPSCQEPVTPPMTWARIDGALKRYYLQMKMKCLNPVCERVLDPSNYMDHDDNCSVTFKICDDCGHKSRRGEDSSHSCINVLKDQLTKERARYEDLVAANTVFRNECKEKLRLIMDTFEPIAEEFKELSKSWYLVKKF